MELEEWTTKRPWLDKKTEGLVNGIPESVFFFIIALYLLNIPLVETSGLEAIQMS